MDSTTEELAFKARALAQAHPLSEHARRFVNMVTGEQRTSQPLPEIGIWAGAAVIEGYCLRRVEEAEAVVEVDGRALVEAIWLGTEEDGRREEILEQATNQVAERLRTGAADSVFYAGSLRTEGALDRLIFSQVQRRLEHWRDTIDDAAWKELEEYITWWTVKGYALRCAEVIMGLVPRVSQYEPVISTSASLLAEEGA